MPSDRRTFLRNSLAGIAAIPALPVLLRHQYAFAADKVVSLDNPTAKALSYVHDASKADPAKKVERGGVKPEAQLCSNCMFKQGELKEVSGQEGKWIGCQLFPGQLVNVNGWCQSWQPKPA